MANPVHLRSDDVYELLTFLADFHRVPRGQPVIVGDFDSFRMRWIETTLTEALEGRRSAAVPGEETVAVARPVVEAARVLVSSLLSAEQQGRPVDEWDGLVARAISDNLTRVGPPSETERGELYRQSRLAGTESACSAYLNDGEPSAQARLQVAATGKRYQDFADREERRLDRASARSLMDRAKQRIAAARRADRGGRSR